MIQPRTYIRVTRLGDLLVSLNYSTSHEATGLVCEMMKRKRMSNKKGLNT